jgi:hypothetical protein
LIALRMQYFDADQGQEDSRERFVKS